MAKSLAVDPPSPEDDFEDDPEFRREVVDTILEQARDRHLPVDFRCRRLLEQFADGSISSQQLSSEIVRPVLN